ncbi:IS256 family transposase [Streptomyces sp. NPDC002156]
MPEQPSEPRDLADGVEPTEVVLHDELDAQLIRRLTDRARSEGLALTGTGGLLQQLTKLVLESALEGELEDHLGYAKHAPEGRDGGNSRNGRRAKTVTTESGPVEVAVPRDRDGSFSPTIVPKHARRLPGVEDLILSLSAKGLTHGEISAHLAEVYGAEISKTTITTITDKISERLAEWQKRPLDEVYPVLFLDALHVKIRDGQVANRAIYIALAVTVDGERDILGLWASDGAEGAKYWQRVLAEIKNRGVRDTCIVVCDGLKGLPDAINLTWPEAIVQTCLIHLIRNTFRYAGRQDWAALARDLKPIYTAVSEAAALEEFARFAGIWEQKYPAIIKLWENAWAEFVPFLRFDREIRTVVCSTNAIESLNARLRRAVRARGHFPSEAAALKCLFLAITALDPKGDGRARWARRWKPALNAFELTFEGRLTRHTNIN